METKTRALYFGYTPGGGHFLQGGEQGGNHLDAQRACPGIPWETHLMDGGFLRKGKVVDHVTGEVYWTCGLDRDGVTCWHAFYWWDRSGDLRPASNSGFYVRGFSLGDREKAFAFACDHFRGVVERQQKPLRFAPQPEGRLE